MKKFAGLLCFVLALTLLTNAYGGEVYEYEDDAVVITLEDALEMAVGEMLFLRDIDAILRELPQQRRELNNLHTRMSRGDLRAEQLNALYNQLFMLESQLTQAMLSQQMAMQNIQNDINSAVEGILNNPEEAEQFLIRFMQSAMDGAASSVNMGMEMSMMEAQRAMILSEIQAAQNTEIHQETLRGIRHSVNELDRLSERLNLQQEQAKLSMESALRGMVVTIMELEMSAAALEAELELGEQRLQQITIFYELGMISSRERVAAEHNLERSRRQLDELQRNQINLSQTLNELLGQPLTQNTIIEFDIYLPELPENLRQQARELASTAHSVMQLEIDLAGALGERWVHTGNNREIRITDSDRRRAYPERPGTTQRTPQQEEEIARLRTRIELQEAVERSEAELAQAIRGTEAAILRAYTEFSGLAIQINTLQTELSIAESELDISRVNYNLGLATQLAVDEAKMAVFRVEQSISRVYNQKWLLAFRIMNPSLLG